MDTITGRQEFSRKKGGLDDILLSPSLPTPTLGP